jgi:hypothetical protein
MLRPHSSLGYLTPHEFAADCLAAHATRQGQTHRPGRH